jgi:hypothetical protein
LFGLAAFAHSLCHLDVVVREVRREQAERQNAKPDDAEQA